MSTKTSDTLFYSQLLSIVNIIFHIWIILLAVGFFMECSLFTGTIMALLSLLLIRGLCILLIDVM